jgi:hypothetical protein
MVFDLSQIYAQYGMSHSPPDNATMLNHLNQAHLKDPLSPTTEPFALMAPSSHPIAPFFEPGAPPPPLPSLTTQTELSYHTTMLPKITAHERLPRKHFRTSPIRTTSATYAKANPPSSRPTFYSYTSSGSRKQDVSSESDSSQSFDSSSESSTSSSLSDSLSDSSDSEKDQSDTDSDGAKLQRPQGEPGRPGRGGYNLDGAIGWNGQDLRRLKVCTVTSGMSVSA